MNDKHKANILNEIILAYRREIHNRYDYEKIKDIGLLSTSFSEDKVDELRTYFLTHIYPEPSQRAQLDEAFTHLESHINNPKYLLSVLMDSIGIIFKYGRHLPKILRTGLRAMQSFKKANRFEQQLADAAIASDRKPPFTQSDIEHFTKQIPKQEVERFIDDSLQLFETLHDHDLMSRVVDIVNHLISKMLSKPNVYPAEEVAALELGRDLIKEGYRLFETLSAKDQDRLFELIISIEKNALQRIYE